MKLLTAHSSFPDIWLGVSRLGNVTTDREVATLTEMH